MITEGRQSWRWNIQFWRLVTHPSPNSLVRPKRSNHTLPAWDFLLHSPIQSSQLSTSTVVQKLQTLHYRCMDNLNTLDQLFKEQRELLAAPMGKVTPSFSSEILKRLEEEECMRMVNREVEMERLIQHDINDLQQVTSRSPSIGDTDAGSRQWDVGAFWFTSTDEHDGTITDPTETTTTPRKRIGFVTRAESWSFQVR